VVTQHQSRLGRQRLTCPRLYADGDDPYSCLRSIDEGITSDTVPDSLPPLRLSTLLGSPADADAACGAAAARQAALLAAVRLVGRLASVLRDAAAFPELFGPARRAMEALAARRGLHKVYRSTTMAAQLSRSTPFSSWLPMAAVWAEEVF
jgi:hypothetical protein